MGLKDAHLCEALYHLRGNGWIVSLRTGLYALSSTIPGVTPAHEFEIAMALVDPAAIYVTHDLREAASIGNRIVVMESGRIAQVGTFNELRENPASAFVRDLVEDLQRQGPRRA